MAFAVAAYFGWQYWTVGRFEVSTDDAYVQADNTTVADGSTPAGQASDTNDGAITFPALTSASAGRATGCSSGLSNCASVAWKVRTGTGDMTR